MRESNQVGFGGLRAGGEKPEWEAGRALVVFSILKHWAVAGCTNALSYSIDASAMSRADEAVSVGMRAGTQGMHDAITLTGGA